MPRRFQAIWLALGLIFVTIPASAPAGTTKAFRLQNLDLRDPHMYVEQIGFCIDVTSNFNSSAQATFSSDDDMDGLLDESFLIIFDPLDQNGAGGPIRFGSSSCTAPAGGTSCGPPENLVTANSTNSMAGTCLGPLAGTVRPYSPAVGSPSAPCFASDEAVLTLALNDIPVTLYHVRVGATYVGSPATSLITGLLRGFLRLSDANATIIPASTPIVGGQTLSSILRGGQGNCNAGSDQDTVDGVPGWWMYFNFSATEVPYTGPQLDVPQYDVTATALSFANPSQLPMRVGYRLGAGGAARLTVHDLSGRKVATLVNEGVSAGEHEITWDGRLDRGGQAAPGLYLLRLTDDVTGTVSKRVMLLR